MYVIYHPGWSCYTCCLPRFPTTTILDEAEMFSTVAAAKKTALSIPIRTEILEIYETFRGRRHT